MSRGSTQVRIFNGALSRRSNGSTILRGEIDSESLVHIDVDTKYQRGVRRGKKEEQLQDEFNNGEDVLDVRLGMRGSSFEDLGDGVFILKDPVYAVDGLQRINGAIQSMIISGQKPWLGASIKFETDKMVEKEEFDTINLNQSKITGNLHLRNMREDVGHKAIGALYRLTQPTGKEDEFVLAGRIQWEDTKLVADLVSAVNFAKVAGMLHSHAGPGRSTNVVQLADGLELIMGNVGRRNLTANVKRFFEVLDQAYGVKDLGKNSPRPHLNAMFMLQLAKLFSDHRLFWDDDRKLVVDAPTVKKLGLFEPDVVAVKGTTKELLYELLRKHLDSGRRKNRLVSRDAEGIG